MFEAVILMGGFGTRLKEISGEIPKPMVLVGSDPFVYRLMKKLELAGCSKIILSLYYGASFIIESIRADNPVACDVVFVVEEVPLGTGGALKFAAKEISTEYFIAMNGDTFSGVDYHDLICQKGTADIIISGVEVKNIARYGSLEFDSSLKLTGMSEKGSEGAGVINSGTYLIRTSSILSVKEERFSFEEFYLPTYKPKTSVMVFDGDFIDIGIPSDYFLACEKFS